MKHFRLEYIDGSFEIVEGINSLAVIKRYDLATLKHVKTRITELSEWPELFDGAQSQLDYHKGLKC